MDGGLGLAGLGLRRFSVHLPTIDNSPMALDCSEHCRPNDDGGAAGRMPAFIAHHGQFRGDIEPATA